MKKPTCPTCNKPVELNPPNSSFPFCNERCKLIDLGNWLGDKYVVSSDAPFDEEGDQITDSSDKFLPPSRNR